MLLPLHYLFHSSLSARRVYLFCPLQGIHHYCSGPVVRVRHHVDLWLFPVWKKHNNHVLPIYNFWKPSRGYALCHALSVYQTGESQLFFQTKRKKRKSITGINLNNLFLGKRRVCEYFFKIVCTNKKELHRVQILKFQQNTGKDSLVLGQNLNIQFCVLNIGQIFFLS